MQLEYVTHASLRLTSERGRTLLIDPWYWLDPGASSLIVQYPPRSIVPSQFGRIHYLHSSHHHKDHSHPHTLTQLRPYVDTVLLPAERPQLEKRYRDLGYEAIRILPNGMPVELEEGLRVTSFWSDAVDTALLVEMEGKSVLHVNDCQLRPELWAHIGKTVKLDYACMLYTPIFDPYPLILPRSYEEIDAMLRQSEVGFQKLQLKRLADLRPRVVIPYSMCVSFFQPDQLHLNRYYRTMPAQFAQMVREKLPGTEAWVLDPGDTVDCATDTIHRHNPQLLWPPDHEANAQAVAQYAAARQHELPKFDAGQAEDCREPLLQRLEKTVRGEWVALTLPLLSTLSIRAEGQDGAAIGYTVNLKERSVCPEVPEADLTVTAPASMMGAVLSGYASAFDMLFSYRVRFAPRQPFPITPLQEAEFYGQLLAAVLGA